MSEKPKKTTEELKKELEEKKAERDKLVDDPNDYANGAKIQRLDWQISAIQREIGLLLSKGLSEEKNGGEDRRHCNLQHEQEQRKKRTQEAHNKAMRQLKILFDDKKRVIPFLMCWGKVCSAIW